MTREDMCAINPTHKKRLILDVYTSQSGITEEEFVEKVLSRAITMECQLNAKADLRWHVKESEEKVD
jgi:hypothetical protein